MHIAGAGGSAVIDMDVGDKVILIFCDRSIDKYMQTGGPTNKPVTPASKRRFSISDAVAIAGLRTHLEPLPADAWHVGGTTIKSPDLRLGSSLAFDFVALASLVLANFTSFKTAFDLHTHAGVGTPPTLEMPEPSSVAATKVKAE
jgi:hypothetical protein